MLEIIEDPKSVQSEDQRELGKEISRAERWGDK